MKEKGLAQILVVAVILALAVGYYLGQHTNKTPTQSIASDSSFQPVFKNQYENGYANKALKNIKENLLSFKCSDDFSSQKSSGIVKNANNTLPGHAETSFIIECRTQDDRKFIIYTLSYPGGGAGSDTYFATLQPDEKVDRPIIVPNDKSAYFSCLTPLEYTETNNLYVQCSGSEGSSTSIYKIDFNKMNAELLYKIP